MEKTVKPIGARQLISVSLAAACVAATTLMFLLSYFFGALARGSKSLSVIELIERVLRILGNFSWLNVLNLAFGIVYIVILVKTITAVIDLFKSMAKFAKALPSRDSASLLGSMGSIRESFDTMLMLYIVYLVQGVALTGEGVSTLGFATLVVGAATFIVTNLSITYSLPNLPRWDYLLIELLRFVAVPYMLLKMFGFLRLSGAYQGIGYMITAFFSYELDGIDGKFVVQLIYTHFAEPVFLILIMINFLLLCSATIRNLFRINDPTMYDTTPKDKFFGIVKLVSAWMVCRCVVYTFFIYGDIDVDVEKFFNKWLGLIRDDLLPLLLFAVAGGVLLLYRCDKNIDTLKGKKDKWSRNFDSSVFDEGLSDGRTSSYSTINVDEPFDFSSTMSTPASNMQATVENEPVVQSPVIPQPSVAPQPSVTPQPSGAPQPSVAPQPSAAPQPRPAAPGKVFCKHCGGTIDADSMFCSYCGQKVN